MTDDRHEFGGPWTEIKLAVLNAYSEFFTTALSGQKFELWYIDAFAGTGRRTTRREVGGLFDGPLETVEESLEGSARKAIAVQPPFDHLILIDERAGHFRALETLAGEFTNRDIRPLRGDANDTLPKLFEQPPWSGRQGWRQRAIVFLDPYGINVRWRTLASLAATERADIWYLVNLKGVVQQLALDRRGLDESKQAALTEFFGSPNWEERFYERTGQTGLFDNLIDDAGKRIVTRTDVALYYREQLESIFRYVSAPMGLTVGKIPDYFQLYCLSNNPSDKARNLIARGANGVFKHVRASHQRSGL